MAPATRTPRHTGWRGRVLRSWFLLIVGFGMMSLLGYVVIQKAWQNHAVNQELTELEREITSLESQNGELADFIAYLNSPGYEETAAKERLNLQVPGETVVALPQREGETNAGLDSIDADAEAASLAIAEQPNWRKWWEYYFGPQ